MKKKVICLAIAGLLGIQLVACQKATDTSSPDDSTGSIQQEDQESAQSGESGDDSEETSQVEEDRESAASDDAPLDGMPNPWRDITEQEAKELIPDLFTAPEEATDIYWSVMDAGIDSSALPGPLVQLKFDLYGMSFTERARATEDENEDISGMYYDWTVSEDVTFETSGGNTIEGKTSRFIGEDESADLVTWYDAETSVSYSLSTVAADLDGFDITAVAGATL